MSEDKLKSRLDLTDKYGALLDESIEKVDDFDTLEAPGDFANSFRVVRRKEDEPKGFRIFGTFWFTVLVLFFTLNVFYYTFYSYSPPILSMKRADLQVERALGGSELFKPFQGLRDFKHSYRKEKSSDIKGLVRELNHFFPKDEFGRGKKLNSKKIIFSSQGFHYSEG